MRFSAPSNISRPNIWDTNYLGPAPPRAAPRPLPGERSPIPPPARCWTGSGTSCARSGSRPGGPSGRWAWGPPSCSSSSAWPAVTDEQHAVDGVPAGCKRVSETLALVDDEHDSYAGDDIPLSRLVTDPELDVAVVKARGDLHVIPWKVGHSAGIRERNLVEVRGFPLGAFRATNIGKVISAHVGGSCAPMMEGMFEL